MQKTKGLLLSISLLFLLGCQKDRVHYNNPFIPNYSFSIDLNLNLPSYSNLNFVANPILITLDGVGVKGIFVMKTSTTDYVAFEANCPNQYPSDCSRMVIKGVSALCPCDNIEYSLFTGVGKGEYAMKPYRVRVEGNTIRVYN